MNMSSQTLLERQPLNSGHQHMMTVANYSGTKLLYIVRPNKDQLRTETTILHFQIAVWPANSDHAVYPAQSRDHMETIHFGVSVI